MSLDRSGTSILRPGSGYCEINFLLNGFTMFEILMDALTPILHTVVLITFQRD